VTDNWVFFSATDGTHGSEPWVTDGTTQGTQMLKDISPDDAGSDIRQSVFWNNELYFTVSGDGLWKTNGTREGTVRVKAFDYALGVVVINDQLVVSASLQQQVGLWRSNGTDAGTILYFPTTSVRYLSDVMGDLVSFTQRNDGQTQYFITDGTYEGTRRMTTPDGDDFAYMDL
jgi:ELWxxDGT repeat protein